MKPCDEHKQCDWKQRGKTVHGKVLDIEEKLPQFMVSLFSFLFFYLFISNISINNHWNFKYEERRKLKWNKFRLFGVMCAHVMQFNKSIRKKNITQTVWTGTGIISKK